MARSTFFALSLLALQASALNVPRNNGGGTVSVITSVAAYPTSYATPSLVYPSSTFACGDSTFTITISNGQPTGVTTTIIPGGTSSGPVTVTGHPTSSAIASGPVTVSSSLLGRRNNGGANPPISSSWIGDVATFTAPQATSSVAAPTCGFPTITITSSAIPAGTQSTVRVSSSAVPSGTSLGQSESQNLPGGASRFEGSLWVGLLAAAVGLIL